MRLPRLLILAALTAAAVTLQAAGKSALLVIQLKAPAETAAADAAVKQRLEALGFTVTTADQADPATGAAGKDLVVITSGVSANVIEGKYRSVTAPVVTWEAYMLPHVGMTPKKQDADFGTKEEKLRYLWVVNAPHPLAGGLPAGMNNIVKKGGPMNWGRPGPGATVIATFPGELELSPLFAYEKGATMDGENLAPARRVMLFLDNTSFPNLNEAGLKLFDAAVRWAAAPPQP